MSIPMTGRMVLIVRGHLHYEREGALGGKQAPGEGDLVEDIVLGIDVGFDVACEPRFTARSRTGPTPPDRRG